MEEFLLVLFTIIQILYSFNKLVLYMQLRYTYNHGWLGQQGSCHNANIWQSISNTRSRFWFNFKYLIEYLESSTECFKGSATYNRLGQREFLKIWSLKSAVNSLKSNVSNLFNLISTNNNWNYFLNWAVSNSLLAVAYVNVELTM